MCLELEDIAPTFTLHTQGVLLFRCGLNLLVIVYGTITLFGGPFQDTWTKLAGLYHNSTSPYHFWYGFALFCAAFIRHLLTASQMLSFPAGTKMFQFPAFPIPYGIASRNWHEVALGNPRFHGCMLLA